MAEHHSVVKQMPSPTNWSILYGWEINKLSCWCKFFTPATMWFVVRKRRKHRRPPPYDTSQRYPRHLSMYAYCTKIRPSCPLTDSSSNAQVFHVEVPLPKINCFDACYDTNMATNIWFGTLHPSIWKTNWSLRNLWL